MPQILGKALTFIILSKQEDSQCHYGLIEPAYIFFSSLSTYASLHSGHTFVLVSFFLIILCWL